MLVYLELSVTRYNCSHIMHNKGGPKRTVGYTRKRSGFLLLVTTHG